jgi:hypothetical protein
VGTRFTFVRKFLGQKLEASNEFVEYKSDTIVTFRTSSGPMPVVASYFFEPAPEGAKVTCKIEMQPRGFSRLAKPLIAASIRREMAAEFGFLKDLLESREMA